MTQDNLNTIVGNNIKKYRLLYNKTHKDKITQEKLAEAIGSSVSLISNLESKRINQGISITNLYRIAIVLEVPINIFFE